MTAVNGRPQGTIKSGSPSPAALATYDNVIAPTKAAQMPLVVQTSSTQTFIVQQSGGTAGTSEGQVYHDGNSLIISNQNAGATGGPILKLANNSDSLIWQWRTGGNSLVLATNRNTYFSSSDTSIGFVPGTDWTGLGSTISAAVVSLFVQANVVVQGSTSIYAWTSGAANGTKDTALVRVAAGVVGPSDGGATANKWFQNTAGESRRTATQTVTDSTTFVADNTLTATLIAGRKYRFRIRYFFTTVNSSGAKVDLNGGTATMTAINGIIKSYSLAANSFLACAQITALTDSLGNTPTGTAACWEIEGSLTCNAGGTFVPRFAQNAETGAAESVIAQIGSFMELGDVP